MTKPNTSNRKNTFLELGQSATVLAPLLYLLGREYASSYFQEMGCEWVFQHLTFQETLTYTIPIIIPVFTGWALAVLLIKEESDLSKLEPRIAKSPLVVIGLSLISYLLAETAALWDIAQFYVSIYLLMLFGFLIHTYNSPKEQKIITPNFTLIAIVFISLTLYMSTNLLGESVANLKIKNKDANFPILENGFVFGHPTEKRLISKVGEKYLIVELTNDSTQYQLKSSLDSYKIEPLEPNPPLHFLP